MMSRLRVALMITLACAGADQLRPTPPPAPPAPPAQPPPATQEKKPQTLAEAKQEEEERAAKEAAGLPGITAKRIEDIVKLSIKDKTLKIETTVAPTDGAVVQGLPMPGVSKVTVQNATEPGAASTSVMIRFEFENRDFTVPDAIAMYTSVSFAAGQLTIAQMSETLNEDLYSVQLLQHPPQPPNDDGTPSENPQVSLFVQRSGQTNITLNADNVVELRRKFPGEVAKYVDPMFRSLHQEALLARVDPRLAWQVFADVYQPPPDVAAKVKDLVKRLDGEQFDQREAASKQLAELGQPAALILMRQPRAGLSDEQLGRIDAFLAKFRTVSDAEADRLRGDTGFLLDCLYSEDAAIRGKALAELRKLTGKPLQFDLTSDPEQRLAAIAKLREQLNPAPATTQAAPQAARS